jgi:hypothetical protein
MFAALFALLLQLGHVAGPAPAPHGVTGSPAAPAPAVVAPVPAPGGSPSRGGDSAAILPAGGGSQPGPAPVTVVEPQLPEEVAGRQVDCPGGVGTMRADGSVDCPSAP